MRPKAGRCARLVLLAGMLGASLPLAAWEMAGTHAVLLHPREGAPLRLGSVSFQPRDGGFAFTLKLDPERFKVFFLSMRDFKCLEGPAEVQCLVPYPYQNPATVSAGDLAWLEHALLFFYKSPRDFGAKLWNGIYYRLTMTDQGLVGVPQAVDLDRPAFRRHLSGQNS